MFSHVMVGANDIAASRDFYNATLGALGIANGVEDPNGRWLWMTPAGIFAITAPIDGQAATHGNGGTIGFNCESPAQVDAWHAAGVAAGGASVEDPPGVRNADQPNPMYLAYLRDPAGNKLCGLHFVAA